MLRNCLKVTKSILLSIALSTFLLIVFCCQTVKAEEKNFIARWTFDSVVDNRIKDNETEIEDQIYGKYTLVKGVEGKALRFDGFRTYIYRAEDAPRITGNFTIEAWIALGAYPWFWAPVLEFRNTKFEGFMFGINNTGHLGMRVPAGDKWQSYLSDQQLPLRTWTHIAAVCDKKKPTVPLCERPTYKFFQTKKEAFNSRRNTYAYRSQLHPGTLDRRPKTS